MRDAIGAERSDRWTFGAARRDWRKAQQSLDLRFAHECYHYLGVRLRDAIGAERSDRWISRFGTQIVAALRLQIRLRKRDGVLKSASNKCALQVFFAHPLLAEVSIALSAGELFPRTPCRCLVFSVAFLVKKSRRKILLVGVLYPHSPKLLHDVIDLLLCVA